MNEIDQIKRSLSENIHELNQESIEVFQYQLNELS